MPFTAGQAKAEPLTYSLDRTAGDLSGSFVIDSTKIQSGKLGSENEPPSVPLNPELLTFVPSYSESIPVNPASSAITGSAAATLYVSRGDYDRLQVGVSANSMQTEGYFGGPLFDAPGSNRQSSSQSKPLLPTSVNAGKAAFNNVRSGGWFDPATAHGFDYHITTPGALFTSITLPTGFNKPFTISSGGSILGTPLSSGGSILGTVMGGQSFTFPGVGVTEFEVTGITPLVDPTDNSAFPLQIFFNEPSASFTIEALPDPAAAIPEPAALALLVIAAGIMLLARIVKRRLAATGPLEISARRMAISRLPNAGVVIAGIKAADIRASRCPCSNNG
jgi:hypothetical protein